MTLSGASAEPSPVLMLRMTRMSSVERSVNCLSPWTTSDRTDMEVGWKAGQFELIVTRERGQEAKPAQRIRASCPVSIGLGFCSNLSLDSLSVAHVANRSRVGTELV